MSFQKRTRISRIAFFFFLLYVIGFSLLDQPSVFSSATEEDAGASYLRSFGWDVEKDISETVYFSIPTEFDYVYEQYNTLQKKQGFDLAPFKGKNVCKNVYRIKNYPGAENDITIKADILIYNGNIIGADVCSVRLDGFMHGVNECLYGKNQTG